MFQGLIEIKVRLLSGAKKRNEYFRKIYKYMLIFQGK